MSHDDFNLLCPNCGNTTMRDYSPAQGLYDEKGEFISYEQLSEWQLPLKVRFEIRSGQADCSCGFVFEEGTLKAVGEWITISKIISTKEAIERKLAEEKALKEEQAKLNRKAQYEKLRKEFEPTTK